MRTGLEAKTTKIATLTEPLEFESCDMTLFLKFGWLKLVLNLWYWLDLRRKLGIER